jgi:hypothetical protein
MENSPLVLELRNRNKVLQGKLDKQKELTNALEESLRAQPKSHEHAGLSGGQQKAPKVTDTGAASHTTAVKTSRVCTGDHTHFII